MAIICSHCIWQWKRVERSTECDLKIFLNEVFFCCYCKRLTLVLYWKYKISSEICQNIKQCFELDGLFLNGRMENKAYFKLKVSNFLCQIFTACCIFSSHNSQISIYQSSTYLSISLPIYHLSVYLSFLGKELDYDRNLCRHHPGLLLSENIMNAGYINAHVCICR